MPNNGVSFEARAFEVLDLPFDDEVPIAHPERVILKIGRSTVDIGSLCYIRRSEARRKNSTRSQIYPRHVDLSSFSLARSEQVTKLIQFLNYRMTVGGYRPSAIQGSCGEIRAFMDWCDARQLHDALSGEVGTYRAFAEYVEYLREQVNNHTMRQAYAWGTQHKIGKLLESIFDLHDLERGVNLMPSSWRDVIQTEPPSESDLAKLCGLCAAVFEGMSDFVLNAKPYPFRVEMPRYLDWSEQGLWIFPEQQWCMPPHLLERRERRAGRARRNPNYDYRNGRVLSFEQAIATRAGCKVTRQAAQQVRDLIDAANRDPRSYHRQKAAMLAHNCFLVLFIAKTGLNPSVACELKWADDMSVDSAQQGFRELKWRAGGKAVSVVVRGTFLPLFKTFVSLRSYILGGKSHGSLFLTRGPNLGHDLGPASPSAISAVQTVLRRIDPGLKTVPARALRAAKQDFHITQSDPATAAQIMGHSEEIALRAYSAGTKGRHYAEMSGFLESMKRSAERRVVLSECDSLSGAKTGSLGKCVDFNSPVPISGNVPIAPDCRKHEGCLFCDKYRVHADATDVRKLASCAYVIEQTLSVPGAEEHFRPVLERISEVLGEISNLSLHADMVARVVREVEVEGELDAYWAEKLTLLTEIEIAR
ncbi:site-specific integrase [Paraburkholderia atlantica]|uniref:site-specific integrase n=1 Tax=Paraburkholderia atlantica TaxID=2654982 RepID=UPI00160B89DB|nr:site-specific integrase [Paraburkholderia atlantica]MBB5510844.1 integrase [Paraburkholderia atlantica]